jgi:hypothetical protein
MQSNKSLEREVQDKFFDIITNQKENNPSDAFKVYQKLVFYRYEDIVKSTFVQFVKNISENELENSIYAFLKNPPKTEFVWKIANDYMKFVKKQKLFHDRKYLYELLYFDWIEVEIYMKEYKLKENDFSWNSSYSLSKSARVKRFDYDIINANYQEKRENYLIIYYNFDTNEVLFREINQFIYVLIKKLKHSTLESTLNEICKENEIELLEAKEILQEPLMELIQNRALVLN